MAGAIARIVAEIERFGGYVKDLAGDGVLAFFGAPVASEDDAERALLAGLAIVESMSGYASEVERGWGIGDFGVRVGVTTGPVVVGAVGAGERVEYAAFGDTVNTAARLQGAADPGSILVDATTHRLAEGLFEWGEPTQHELKGKVEPVVTHLRCGHVPTRSSHAASSASRRRSSDAITGREPKRTAVGGSSSSTPPTAWPSPSRSPRSPSTTSATSRS